ncbi:hypothetical protein KC909_04760 [Candidatus Dojkabacteria bacterium]|uniref:Uncharacterized protein n=1 Tax=Candidatus Dojkabacteria bacterium TaxID=2099670 RepID=A0A955RJC3_9BACT|nr:hypothetical protein [Candidatus Dojkabacteria bacterium]
MSECNHIIPGFIPRELDNRTIREYQRRYMGTLQAEGINEWRPNIGENRPYLMKPTRLGPWYLQEPVFCRRLEKEWLQITAEGDLDQDVEVANGYLIDLDSMNNNWVGSSYVPLNRKVKKGGEKTGLAFGFVVDQPVSYATSPWIVGLAGEQIIFDKFGRFDFEREGIVPSAFLGRKVFLPQEVNNIIFGDIIDRYGLDLVSIETGILRSLVVRFIHRFAGRKDIADLFAIQDLEV